MASQNGKDCRGWRRAVTGVLASSVVAAGLMTGFATSTAFAQPAEPTTETQAPSPEAEGPKEPCTGDDCNKNADEADAPKKMSADQALSVIYNQYAQGDGGGQISKLIDDAMKLRSQGFRPSKANGDALADALERRPNQTPLVEALKTTIAYQRKLQSQAAMSAAEGPVAGPVPVIPGMTVPLG